MSRLLFCEDEEAWRDLIIENCKNLGVECRAVETPLEALDEVSSRSYEMILLDIQNLKMPGGKWRGDMGYFARRIKEFSPGAIIIGVSGIHPDDQPEEVRACFDELAWKCYDSGNPNILGLPRLDRILGKYHLISLTRTK